MLTFRTLAPCVLALGLLAPATARAEEGRAALIQAKAASAVSVKITAKISGSFGGRAVDQERNITASGVVVDPAGLVMIPANSVSAPARLGMEIKVTPTSIRVIFPGDETEYDAILGAMDSKLGLAYVLVRDLKGRALSPVDMTQVAEPVVGDMLYSVTRMPQGFDYAPVCQSAEVIGQVSKPRTMWVVDGSAPEPAQPLYTAAGKLAGIMIVQEGVGEESGSQIFLLPLKVAQSSIERSLKASQKELEDVKAREAEAAAKAAEQGEKAPEAPAAPAEPAPAEPAAPEQPK
ncbi:MAG: hypothetical protein ACKOSS_04135 [Planctomycetia bacterium]